MFNKTDEGYGISLASTGQLDSYRRAQEQLHAFATPVLFDASDRHSRVFFAFFDGTGNNARTDPEHITNIGLLDREIRLIGENDDRIGVHYIEGPGTQDGLQGKIDKAWGGSFNDRVEAMYDQFSRRAANWIKEDPEANISVVCVGFSRGGEQAPAFTRLVETRGAAEPTAKVVDNFRGQREVYYVASPLRAPGTIPQALGLFDPVGTGEPQKHDRRPAPSVVTGFQISAEDERRDLFPLSSIIETGLSADGRFLGVTTAGAHSDIGGGFLKDGLARCNFNLMASFLNGVLSEPLLEPRVTPPQSEMLVHDAWVGYFVRQERVVNSKREPTGKLSIEAVNPPLEEIVSGRSVPGLRGETVVVSLDDTSTAAFNDIGRHQEIALVLHEAAGRLRDEQAVPFALEDTNGNHVGRVEVCGPGASAAQRVLPEGGLRITLDLGNASMGNQPMLQVANLLDIAAQHIAENSTDTGFPFTDERGALLGLVVIDSGSSSKPLLQRGEAAPGPAM